MQSMPPLDWQPVLTQVHALHDNNKMECNQLVAAAQDLCFGTVDRDVILEAKESFLHNVPVNSTETEILGRSNNLRLL